MDKKAIEKDVTRRFLITLINEIGQVSQELSSLFPADNETTLNGCHKHFVEELNQYLWKSQEFSGITRDNKSFYIRDMKKNEYKLEYSEENSVIILYLMREDYVEDNISYKQVELIRYRFREYIEAIYSIEKINAIVFEERNRKKTFSKLTYDVENIKLYEIACNSLISACLAHNEDFCYIKPLFTENMGYILISPDGEQMFILFVALKCFHEKSQKILELLNNPSQFEDEQGFIECIPLHCKSLDINRLKRINNADDIIKILFRNYF